MLPQVNAEAKLKGSGVPTLQSVITELCGRGDRPAVVVFGDAGAETRSYADLADRVHSLARGLTEIGVGRGDMVAILAPTRPESIAACLATLAAGAVIVPLDVQCSDSTLSHYLSDSGAGVIFTIAEEAARLESIEVPNRPRLVLLDRDDADPRSWLHLLRDAGADLPRVEPDDPAALFYTSGTTGAPKGVPLSHANLRFQIDTVRNSGLTGTDDRILMPLPLHHVYPFVMGLLTPFEMGLTIVLPAALTGPQLLHAIRDGRVTLIIGVPRLYRAIYTGIESRFESGGRFAVSFFRAAMSLSSWLYRRVGVHAGKILFSPLHRKVGSGLRILASGGSALDPDLALKLEALGWRIANGYGLTETAPLLTMNLPGSGSLDSVGKAVPGVDLRIAGEDIGPGEVQVRGPNVFRGYRNRPQETRDAFTEDGWFRTGDLGSLGAGGELVLIGRASTLIVTESGENVQPEDVEAAFQHSPVIREIGVLQKRGRILAVIVPELGEIRRNSEAGSDPAIRAAVREASKPLPSYQRPVDFVVRREPLPRTPIGKIRRHLLAEIYDRAKAAEQPAKGQTARPMSPEEMSAEDRRLLRHPAAAAVWEWLARRFSDQPLTLDTSPQLDLGVDSLGWVELTLEIGEAAGVDLDEEAIGRIETVRDLLQEVTLAATADGSRSRTSPLEDPDSFLSEEQMLWLRPLRPLQVGCAFVLYVVHWIVIRGLFRLRVEGGERLPDNGQFLLAPNHLSHLDPSALTPALGFRRMRETYWAGWAPILFANPLFRLVSRLAQVVPIDTERGIISNLAFGAAALKRGKNLVVFPEGERSRDGKLLPFKPGIGMLLEHFQVPVVPVSIRGTGAVLPPGKRIPRLKTIRIVFGSPLDPAELERQGEGSKPHDRIVQALRDRFVELMARNPE
jgi:long-chain acyl-CoA synthetase